ncbi:unannotated protein [freshwater metagenome]|uniref:Unannotated protein n=1 Tax=freshwater metagenome TaxID=449393 RepID=A0A6J7BKX7_9ZZZZ
MGVEIDLIIEWINRILQAFSIFGKNRIHFNNEFILQGEVGQKYALAVIVIGIDGGAVQRSRNDGMGRGVYESGVANFIAGKSHDGFGVESSQSGDDIERDRIALDPDMGRALTRLVARYVQTGHFAPFLSD